jgi:hypothetical protein
MTDFAYPDNDSASVSSTHTFNSNDSTDSLFGLPPLCNQSISSTDSSSDDDTIDNGPPLRRRCLFVDSSDDESKTSQFFRATRFEQIDVETGLSDTSYETAQDDDLSMSTTKSLFPNLDNLGPPPPGSLMDMWDTPFSTSCLHNFSSRDSDTASATDTDSSLELCNDDDTYVEFNPICPHPVLSLTRVTTSVQLVGLHDGSEFPFIARFEIPEKFRSKFWFRAIFRDFWSRSRRNHFLGIAFFDFLIKETEM